MAWVPAFLEVDIRTASGWANMQREEKGVSNATKRWKSCREDLQRNGCTISLNRDLKVPFVKLQGLRKVGQKNGHESKTKQSSRIASPRQSDQAVFFFFFSFFFSFFVFFFKSLSHIFLTYAGSCVSDNSHLHGVLTQVFIRLGSARRFPGPDLHL